MRISDWSSDVCSSDLEVEHLKGFLSRQNDTARMSYARLPVIVPRQCVIFGTTNSERYLRDLTGNRRFWPVRVDGFDLPRLRADVDQLWAEAATREASGDSIRRSEEHTSELQSLMRISYAVFC